MFLAVDRVRKILDNYTFAGNNEKTYQIARGVINADPLLSQLAKMRVDATEADKPHPFREEALLTNFANPGAVFKERGDVLFVLFCATSVFFNLNQQIILGITDIGAIRDHFYKNTTSRINRFGFNETSSTGRIRNRIEGRIAINHCTHDIFVFTVNTSLKDSYHNSQTVIKIEHHIMDPNPTIGAVMQSTTSASLAVAEAGISVTTLSMCQELINWFVDQENEVINYDGRILLSMLDACTTLTGITDFIFIFKFFSYIDFYILSN